MELPKTHSCRSDFSGSSIVASEKYAWLNTIVSIGVGERLPNGASYDVFEVL